MMKRNKDNSFTLFAGNENLSYTERLKIHLQQSQNLLPKSSGEPTKVHAGLIKQELNLFHDTDGKEKSKYLLSYWLIKRTGKNLQ